MIIRIGNNDYDVKDLNQGLVPVQDASKIFNRSEPQFKKVCSELGIPVIAIRGSLPGQGNKKQNFYFVQQEIFMQKIRNVQQVKEKKIQPKTIGQLSMASWNKITTTQNYIKQDKESHFDYLERLRPPRAGVLIMRLNLLAYQNAERLSQRFDYSRLKSAEKIKQNLNKAVIEIVDYEKQHESTRDLYVELLNSIDDNQTYSLYQKLCNIDSVPIMKSDKFYNDFREVLNLLRAI